MYHAREKIKKRSDMKSLAHRLRTAGKRLVTTNGAFDLLHPGHIYMLERAREAGDVLIVGINSDASIKRNKGDDRPIQPADARAEVLAGLASVDYVFIFDEDDPCAFLEEIMPDVHVNSEEYGENCIERETVERHGGRLLLVERIGTFSTTSLLEKRKPK